MLVLQLYMAIVKGQISQHCREAERELSPAEAVNFYLKQGQQDCNQAKWAEAIALCEQALELLEPEGESVQPNLEAEQADSMRDRIASQTAPLSTVQLDQKVVRFFDQNQAQIPEMGNCLFSCKDAGGQRNRVGIWKRIGQFKRAAGDWYEALRLEVLGTQSQRSGLDRTQFVQPKQKQMRSPKAPKIQASQPDPGLAARYCHDAELMASQGEWEQAIAHYALAVECDPENGQLHYGLGQVFAVKAHWEQAVTCFERAISLNPEILPAYLDLRNALVQSCRWEEMMNNATLHIGLGRAMAAQQRWREAVGFFRRAAQIDPDRVEVYIGLREALLQLERWEDAQYPAQKIVELQPGYLVGRNSEPELNRL